MSWLYYIEHKVSYVINDIFAVFQKCSLLDFVISGLFVSIVTQNIICWT